jgi:hypothetical protein
VPERHRLADRPVERRQVETFVAPGQLLNHDDPLLARQRDGERGPATRPQRRMTFFDRQLYVLRVMVQPADDD